MKDQQTPTKLSPRSAENSTGKSTGKSDFPAKKSKKISKKSLNASSASFSEESFDLSPISDITEENLTEDVTTFLLEEPASVTLLKTEKITDIEENSSTNGFDVCEFESMCVEDELTMNFLKSFKADENLISDNADAQYRKLRDEIIEYVLQDLNRDALLEEKSDMRSQSQVVSQKKPFWFLCVIIWFIGVLAVFFFTTDVDCGLVPT